MPKSKRPASSGAKINSHRKSGTEPADGGGGLSGFKGCQTVNFNTTSPSGILTATLFDTLDYTVYSYFFRHRKPVSTVSWQMSRQNCNISDICGSQSGTLKVHFQAVI